MIKKKYAVLFLAIGLGIFFMMQKEVPTTLTKIKRTETTLTLNQPRKIIDQNKKPLSRIPASLKYVNSPSPDWKSRLETSLKAQSGDSLKSVKIRKESSLVWMRDENPLLVESVIITLTSKRAAESSFRALVDSQTGKVLESWDRTISDPADVRGGFRIKLDPRYSNAN